MLSDIKITKGQAEEHIIGKKRGEFIADLDRLDELLLKWVLGAVPDKSLALHMGRKLDAIRRSITIYK